MRKRRSSLSGKADEACSDRPLSCINSLQASVLALQTNPWPSWARPTRFDYINYCIALQTPQDSPSTYDQFVKDSTRQQRDANPDYWRRCTLCNDKLFSVDRSYHSHVRWSMGHVLKLVNNAQVAARIVGRHQCDFCTSAFSKKSDRDRHMETCPTKKRKRSQNFDSVADENVRREHFATSASGEGSTYPEEMQAGSHQVASTEPFLPGFAIMPTDVDTPTQQSGSLTDAYPTIVVNVTEDAEMDTDLQGQQPINFAGTRVSSLAPLIETDGVRKETGPGSRSSASSPGMSSRNDSVHGQTVPKEQRDHEASNTLVKKPPHHLSKTTRYAPIPIRLDNSAKKPLPSRRFIRCNLCDKDYLNDGDSKVAHFKTHHADLQSATRACEPCSISFRWVKDLEHHIKCAAKGDCGFKFQHEGNCTGHHPPDQRHNHAELFERVLHWETQQAGQLIDNTDPPQDVQSIKVWSLTDAMTQQLSSISLVQGTSPYRSAPSRLDYGIRRSGAADKQRLRTWRSTTFRQDIESSKVDVLTGQLHTSMMTEAIEDDDLGTVQYLLFKGFALDDWLTGPGFDPPYPQMRAFGLAASLGRESMVLCIHKHEPRLDILGDVPTTSPLENIRTIECLTILLEAGASPGQYTLYELVRHYINSGWISGIRLLTDHGAKITTEHLCLALEDASRASSDAFAAERLEVIRFLLERDCHSSNKRSCIVMQYGREVRSTKYAETYDHQKAVAREFHRTLGTALHKAFQIQRQDVATLLSEFVTDRPPPNTVKYALSDAVVNGHYHLVELLLSKGYLAGASDLAAAVKSGHIEIFKLLLSHGLTVNDRHDGKLPLDWAVEAGDLNLVEFIVREPMKIDPQWVPDQTTVCDAVRMMRKDNALEIVRVLIAYAPALAEPLKIARRWAGYYTVEEEPVFSRILEMVQLLTLKHTETSPDEAF